MGKLVLVMLLMSGGPDHRAKALVVGRPIPAAQCLAKLAAPVDLPAGTLLLRSCRRDTRREV